MTTQRLELLIEKHRELDDKVDATARQRFLTPRERLQLKEWKVLRLQCRDTIDRLKKELNFNEVDSSQER